PSTRRSAGELFDLEQDRATRPVRFLVVAYRLELGRLKAVEAFDDLGGGQLVVVRDAECRRRRLGPFFRFTRLHPRGLGRRFARLPDRGWGRLHAGAAAPPSPAEHGLGALERDGDAFLHLLAQLRSAEFERVLTESLGLRHLTLRLLTPLADL